MLLAVTAVATALVGLVLPSPSAVALERNATIVETTPQGYHLVLALRGRAGSLRVSCPDGKQLGAARFTLDDKKRFTAATSSWTFSGRVDARNHFKGHGTTRHTPCGAASGTFSEPVPKRVVWTTCPVDDVLDPVAAGTPITFAGVLPGAALGTHLRIEYTDPGPAITDVVHLTTDAAGGFSDTHAFPSDDGTEYGADAIARYPDDSLATGVGCSVFIQ
jgi:hypothetical protein